MKKNLLRIIIALVAFCVMLPSVVLRFKEEAKNNVVIPAINYNDFEVKLSKKEFDSTLDKFGEIGINTVMIGEESVNSLISSGYITGIKYNVLCHKYDDESEEIIKALKDNKAIHNDSYVLITKRDDCKEYLDLWFGAKYSSNEYTKIETEYNADVYVIYEGAAEAWQITTGFIPQKIENARKHGKDVVLSMMVGNFSTTKYVDIIESLIKKYDIKFINLKSNYREQEREEKGMFKNYNALCRLIRNNKLTLIITENQDHLSNQKPFGYDKLIQSADGRVIRSYETVDYGFTSGTDYKFRYYQMLNSVIDRNIRFISMTLLTNGTDTFKSKSERTFESAEALVNKLDEFGYKTQGLNVDFSGYKTNLRLNSAMALIIMIIMALTILEWLTDKKQIWAQVLASAAAFFGVLFTFRVSESLIMLYASLFAIIAPCFCITLVFKLIKERAEKTGMVRMLLQCVIAALASLSLCGLVQTSLLSGVDYYINTDIFRGIKLSLIIPVFYSAIAFGAIFCKNSTGEWVKKFIKFLNSEIKVIWVIIAAVIGGIGFIYILRSGNVNSIASVEAKFRNIITETMSARPRTKEFLVGWPCLVLMVYYIKNAKSRFVQWVLAMGASILFASVINSFCHVFTGAGIIYMRVMNGLYIGAVISAAAYVANLVLVRIVKLIAAKTDGLK